MDSKMQVGVDVVTQIWHMQTVKVCSSSLPLKQISEDMVATWQAETEQQVDTDSTNDLAGIEDHAHDESDDYPDVDVADHTHDE